MMSMREIIQRAKIPLRSELVYICIELQGITNGSG